MSILEIRGLKPELFSIDDEEPWWANEEFAKQDKTAFGWLALRKKVDDNTTLFNWRDQLCNIDQSKERVPNAAEVSWFLIVCYLVQGRWRYLGHVRTLSVDSGGDHVGLVVPEDDSTIVLDRLYDRGIAGYLGLATAWKL